MIPNDGNKDQLIENLTRIALKLRNKVGITEKLEKQSLCPGLKLIVT